jgi:hypothetical protein
VIPRSRNAQPNQTRTPIGVGGWLGEPSSGVGWTLLTFAS